LDNIKYVLIPSLLFLTIPFWSLCAAVLQCFSALVLSAAMPRCFDAAMLRWSMRCRCRCCMGLAGGPHVRRACWCRWWCAKLMGTRPPNAVSS